MPDRIIVTTIIRREPTPPTRAARSDMPLARSSKPNRVRSITTQ